MHYSRPGLIMQRGNDIILLIEPHTLYRYLLLGHSRNLNKQHKVMSSETRGSVSRISLWEHKNLAELDPWEMSWLDIAAPPGVPRSIRARQDNSGFPFGAVVHDGTAETFMRSQGICGRLHLIPPNWKRRGCKKNWGKEILVIKRHVLQIKQQNRWTRIVEVLSDLMPLCPRMTLFVSDFKKWILFNQFFWYNNTMLLRLEKQPVLNWIHHLVKDGGASSSWLQQ